MDLDIVTGPVTIRGVATLLRDGSWVVPRRLPESNLPMDEMLAEKVCMPAGACVEFHTDATEIIWPVRVTAPTGPRPPAPFDVIVDDILHARCLLTGDSTVRTNLPIGMKVVRIWLPQYGFTELGRLRLNKASLVEPTAERPKLVLYGSSITQCSGAAGPSETWPALLAARYRWDLRCLGFSGECHLDPIVARFIRDTPADRIGICVGVNIYSRSSFSRRTFTPALSGFISTIRDGHPQVPIVLISPIATAHREHLPNDIGLTLADIRSEIAVSHRAMCAAGDRNLVLVNGLDILGHSEIDLLGDGLHPTAAGYHHLANRLAVYFSRK